MNNNLRIQERLTKAFRRVMLIASAAAVAGAIILLVVNSRYSSALTNYGFSQGDIGKALTSFTGTRCYMLAAIGYTDEDGIAKAVESHDTMKKKFTDTYWPKVAETLTTASEKQLYEDLSTKLEQYWTVEEQVLSEGTSTDQQASADAQAINRDQLDPLYDEFYSQLVSLLDINVTQGNSLSSSLNILCWGLFVVILAIIAFSAVYSTRLGTSIANGIADPLNALSNRLMTFAAGDFTSPFPEVKTKDEVADMTNTAVEMGNALQTIIKDCGMILLEFSKGNYRVKSDAREAYQGEFSILLTSLQNLKAQMIETMTSIEDASTQVSAGSGNLSEASQGLAEGATEQAGAVEELQATIGEITANIEKSAQTAEDSYQQAKKYAEEADNSRNEMQVMVAAMGRITETSKKIGNIISEIEDIASQTNLLSLNASIEAARAGEAGRGFAVVAEQIRQLSDQSTQSALNTRELIEGALKEVEEGNKAANHVAASIEEVVRGINMVADASKEISTISSDQANSMRQAELGMNQISEVVQSNSATAEESSATSEELSAQAETLDELIQKFQL